MAYQSIILLSLCTWKSGLVNGVTTWADYPIELCTETNYWRPLPKPDNVIGYGYNAIRGPVSSPIFNVSSYEGIRPCRLTIKTKPDGKMVVEGYRLPGYVEEYWFSDNENEHHEEEKGPEKDTSSLNHLQFTLITYESTAQAFLDMRRRWGMIVDEETGYESLFFTLTAPVKYYGGSRFRDTLQSIVRGQTGAAPFYTLRVESPAGRFSMKPYRYAHFVRGFAQRLRDLVRRSDPESAGTFFDEFGTHYPIAGEFGGVDERRVSFTDYFGARCHKKVTIDTLAMCDGLKLKYQYGYPNVRVLLRPQPGDIEYAAAVDLDAAKNESWDFCRRVVDPVSRISSYVAAAGGQFSSRLALHSTRRFPADLANVAAWRNWMETVPAEAATVKVRMAPICELVQIVDRRMDAKTSCKERLDEYLRSREPLLTANPEACDVSSGKMPVAFEEKPPDFWDNLWQQIQSSNQSMQTYCVPTVSFDRTSPCPQASQQERPRSIVGGRYKKPPPPPGPGGTNVVRASCSVVLGSILATLLRSVLAHMVPDV